MKITDINTITTGLHFPEGPAFAPDGSLWAVELKGESLVQYAGGRLQRFQVGGAPNGIAIDATGNIWFCDAAQNAVRKFDPLTQETTTVVTHVDGVVLNKPNDLTFDSAGNLLFTCPGESRTEPTGYACVFRKNGEVKKITTDKYFPNGLAVTPDGASLVIAETYRHRLWKGRWDAATASWQEEHVWCAIGGPDGPGGPDGMAFGPEGHLYVAVFGTSQVRIVNNNGEVIRWLDLPGERPTNCAFDPADQLGLIVTEAEKGCLLSIKNYLA